MINRFRPLAAVVAALVTAGLFVWLGAALSPFAPRLLGFGPDASAHVDVDNYLKRSAP